MRILLISYLFPPVVNPQAILSARLAKYLQRAGHQVTVLAGTDIVTFNSSHGADKTLMHDLDALDIHWVRDRAAQSALMDLKSRLVNHEHCNYWVRESLRIALPICCRNRIDVVYSLSAPTVSNVVGMRLKQNTDIPWVAHFSDPGYLALNVRFKSPLRTYLTHSTERNIFHHADGITFVNEETILRSTAFNPAYRTKCLVLPHSFDPDYFSIKCAENMDKGTIRVSYVGSLYARRSPFDAIRALEHAAAIVGQGQRRCELHLYGVIDPAIQAVLDKERLPLVKVRGPVSYGVSIQAMLASDYLLLIDMPDEDNLYTPSKLIDYLAACRPIIGITSLRSNSARFLRNLGYPVLAPGDVEGLTKLFCRLMTDLPLEVTAQHLEVVENFRADRVVERLAQFLRESVGGV